MERLGVVEYLFRESEFNLLDEDEALGNDVSASDTTETATGQVSGRDIFLAKGCANCHQLPGIKPNPEFAPSLKDLADRKIEKIDFGKTGIPRTLPDYVAVKLQNPRIYGDKLKMPFFDLNPGEAGRLTTFLLGRTNSIPSSYIVQRKGVNLSFPSGEVGEIFNRYKCLTCHRFGGSGGSVAPDLAFEGSKVQKEWLKSYLEKPYAIRPYLVERMPRFNMTAREAETLAQYIELVLRDNGIDAAPELQSGDPENGRRLYSDAYLCQSCHSIDGTGGYYGTALESVAKRLKTAWIATRLVNPHPYEPGAREPVLAIPEKDRADILAFIGTLTKEPKP